MQVLPPSIVSVFTCLQTLITGVLSFIIFDIQFNMIELLGALMVVGGLVFTVLSLRNSEKDDGVDDLIDFEIHSSECSVEDKKPLLLPKSSSKASLR